MDEKKINDKLDKIIDKVVSLEKVAVKHEETLQHHVYRTDLAEENIKLLRDEVEPLKVFQHKLMGAGKLAALSFTAAGAIAAILKFFFHQL